jgi:hypothetical protein
MGSRTRRSDHVSLSAPVVRLLVGLLSVTLIAFWFESHEGVLPNPGQAPLMLVIEQRGRDVTFTVHENVGTLWSKPGAPRAIWTLLVTARRDQTGTTALWQIETSLPWQHPITYGRLPEGFTQMMPGRGAPPTLRPNEHYVVSVRGPAGGGRTGFTFEPPGTTSLDVPQHRWRDATSDLRLRRMLGTLTEAA